MLPKFDQRGKETVLNQDILKVLMRQCTSVFMNKKIFTSSWFVFICIILFWIFLLQNYIFDYPYRLRDIVGNWVSFFVILIYLWGIFVGIIRYSNTGTGIFVYVNLIPLIVFLVIRYTLKNFQLVAVYTQQNLHQQIKLENEYPRFGLILV